MSAKHQVHIHRTIISPVMTSGRRGSGDEEAPLSSTIGLSQATLSAGVTPRVNICTKIWNTRYLRVPSQRKRGRDLVISTFVAFLRHL